MTNIDYLYNSDAARATFDKNYFVYKNLGLRIIERGMIVPYVLVRNDDKRVWEFGGVVDGNGKFIKSSVGKFGAETVYTPQVDVPYVPATVIYCGLFYPIWGHFVTEGLRYFWAFGNGVFGKYFGDCKLAYIPCELKYHVDSNKNYRRLMEIAGVDVDKLTPIDRPTQFENIIVLDESFFMDGNDGQMRFTDAYRETVDRVRNFALKNQTPSAKKVYYLYGKMQFGEERLAEYFRGKGYEIFSPEKLTLDEQLNVLINAESFASTLGSCSHNSIFLRDGAEVILIPRAANRFTAYQLQIDQVHPQAVNYVDSSLSTFDTRNGPYCFIISPQLKKFFGDNFGGYSDDDFKIFLDYAKRAVNAGLTFDAGGNYYGAVLTDFLAQLKRREDLLTAYGVNIYDD